MFEQLLNSIQFLSPQQSQGLSNFGDKLKSIGNPAAFQEEQKTKLMQLEQDKFKQEQGRQSALQELFSQPNQDPIATLQKAAQIEPALIPKLLEYQIAQQNAQKPDWKMQEVDGALVRYNANDPNSKPEAVYGSIGGGKPQTNVAKLKADFDKGLIDQDTYTRALAKETAPTEKNYKQFQLQNASFADRMVNTANILTPFEERIAKGEFNPISKTGSTLGSIPLVGDFAENAYISEDQQKYRNAAQEWIRAKLRKESGAAIGVKEMDDEFKTYFPQIGDKPEVIKQKKQLRKVATDSMIKQTSGAYDDMYGDARSAPATPSSSYKDGQTATGANGQKIVFKGGKWQPL